YIANRVNNPRFSLGTPLLYGFLCKFSELPTRIRMSFLKRQWIYLNCDSGVRVFRIANGLDRLIDLTNNSAGGGIEVAKFLGFSHYRVSKMPNVITEFRLYLGNLTLTNAL